MARKKYLVDLTAEERQTLEQIVHKGKSSARQLTRARILLKADEGLEDEAIAEAVGTSVATIERTRQRFVESSLDALNELPRPGGSPKLSGKQEAQLSAGAGTPAPCGRARWTLERLAAQAVELGLTDSLAREPVRQVRKKPPSSRGGTSRGVCPR
jgi:transposase